MSPTPCVPCCSSPQITDIPGMDGEDGSNGSPGAAGAAGAAAFTTTTADFNVPAAKGGTVTISVVDTSQMATGQTVVADGPATFSVTTIVGPTSVTLTWLQAPSDVAAGAAITSGATVSPSGPYPALFDSTVSYGTGGPQAMTITSSQILSVSVVIPRTGKYLLFARVLCNYAAATFAAVKTLTFKVRRTNNTAADISNAATTAKMQVITTETYTVPMQPIPTVLYSATAGDILQIYGSLETAPGAGAVNAQEAELLAQQIS